MPELPEVETVRRSLAPHLMGRKIEEVKVIMPKIIKYPESQRFVELLTGEVIQELKRRGKYLLFSLSSNYIWVTHLRMTGQYIYTKPQVPRDKHTHLIFILDNGYELRYVDIRKFGMMYLLRPEEFSVAKGLYTLGPEPLDKDFTLAQLKERLAGKKRKLKPLLLDQTFVAGIGNIYADEILFDAGLHPEREAMTLSPEEIERLFKSIQKILQLGIENRGTSIRNYVDGQGNMGGFQKLLKVYGKAGSSCPVCGQPIVRKAVGGRGTYFCANCQQ